MVEVADYSLPEFVTLVGNTLNPKRQYNDLHPLVYDELSIIPNSEAILSKLVFIYKHCDSKQLCLFESAIDGFYGKLTDLVRMDNT